MSNGISLEQITISGFDKYQTKSIFEEIVHLRTRESSGRADTFRNLILGSGQLLLSAGHRLCSLSAMRFPLEQKFLFPGGVQ